MKRRIYYYEDDNIKNKQIAARYRFCLEFVKDKLVVDIGCGARSGPYMLSKVASKVVAIDISQEAIIYNAKKWPRNNLLYIAADAKSLPFKDNFFDCVLSFEVIEHIDDYDSYLNETKRILKAGRVFIISTPNRPIASPRGILSNPDHIREFDSEEFKNILRRHFSNFILYGQKPLIKVIKAENFLSHLHQNLDKVPSLFKRILSERLKRKIRKMLVSFFAELKVSPDPNQITEKDFIFEEKNIEKARNFLAICRK